jgi:hypothetical protein
VVPSSLDPDTDELPEEFAGEFAEELVGVAVALWSPVAMSPTSAPPTATLTPAARMRPRVLKLRRAIRQLWRRNVRDC